MSLDDGIELMALAYGWAPVDVWPLSLAELADWSGRAERVLKARVGK